MKLSEMYDRLYDLEQRPETPEILWAIADVREAIEQTLTGDY